MVPAGEPTETVVAELAGRLGPGDVVVGGGNAGKRLRCAGPASWRREASASSTPAPAARCGAAPRATA